eukprot:499755_1
MAIDNNKTTFKLPSPPPLQTSILNMEKNESIENNKEHIETPVLEQPYKSNAHAEIAVPPLELLTEDTFDIEDEVEENRNIILETSEIHSNGHENHNNDENTNNNNNNQRTNTNTNNNTNTNTNNNANTNNNNN